MVWGDETRGAKNSAFRKRRFKRGIIVDQIVKKWALLLSELRQLPLNPSVFIVNSSRILIDPPGRLCVTNLRETLYIFQVRLLSILFSKFSWTFFGVQYRESK